MRARWSPHARRPTFPAARYSRGAPVAEVTVSPLGKYSELAAAATSIAIVGAAIVAHLGVVIVADTAWLDTAAGIAIGVVLGQRQSTNGAGKIAEAAHGRIDTLEHELNLVARPADP